MKIRFNNILKLFATLLFLLEFLSPALAISVKHNDLTNDQMHEKQMPNFWLTIYNEELTEGEENRENEKSQVILLDCVTVLLSLNNTHNTHAGSYATRVSLQYPHQPPLFLLHCIYLI
jgi:hypothetical protein